MHYARSFMEALQLDISGRPQAWISAKEAAVIYASDGIAWTLGDAFFVLRGGMQRRTGLQSRIEVHPIIAVKGSVPSRAWRQTPALSNPKLFARDRGAGVAHRPRRHRVGRLDADRQRRAWGGDGADRRMTTSLQRVCILGATGSIGSNTLDVISRHPDRFEVFALTAHSRVDELFAQCVQCKAL